MGQSTNSLLPAQTRLASQKTKPFTRSFWLQADAVKGGILMSPKELVERFYHELWNHADESLAAEILDADLRFRGSLAPERHGRAGFIDYMRSVHAALGGYTCVIEDLIVSDDSAAAQMTFKGWHQGPLFGVKATGRDVSWEGTAYFRFAGARISELWVESDIEDLKAQLGAGDAEPFQSHRP